MFFEIATTPRSMLVAKLPEAGLGLGTTFHLVPFQCSMSVCGPEPLSWLPTAQASLPDVAATAFRPDEPRLGLDTTRHEQARRVTGSGEAAPDEATDEATGTTSAAIAANGSNTLMRRNLRLRLALQYLF